MKCLLFVNFMSGHSATLYKKGILQKCANDLFDSVEIVTNDGKNHIDIRQKIVNFDTIMVCGGDGTLNTIINQIYDLEKLIVYYPCGTQNDFGRTFIKNKLTGKEILCDIGVINDKIFMYVCATGTLCEVGYKVKRKEKRKFSKLAYFFSALGSFKTYSIQATIRASKIHSATTENKKTSIISKKVDKHSNKIYPSLAIDSNSIDRRESANIVYENNQLSGEYSLIMVAKSQFVGGRQYSKEKYVCDSGKAQLILVDTPKGAFARLKLFARYFRVFVQKKGQKPHKHIAMLDFDSLILLLEEPQILCIDGEKYDNNSTKHTITIRQKKLKIMVIEPS